MPRQRFGILLWPAFVVALTRCEPQVAPLGTVTFGHNGAAGDVGQRGGGAGTAGASPTPSAGAATTGDGLGPFSVPRVIPKLTAAGAQTTDPSVTGDGLEMYMMSTRSGNKDLWVSKRTTVDEEWPQPLPVAELNSDATESNCKVSPDGLNLWFYTDRDRSVGTLWEAHRAKLNDPWGTPSVLPGIGSTTGSDVSVSGDESQLIAVFASLRSHETQGYDLYEARRTSKSVGFGVSKLIEELNGNADDFDPYLSPDGLLVLFHSTRSGNDDILWSKRLNLDSPFDAPLFLSEVNSAAADTAPAMARDRSVVWFASTRDGDEQIYEATALRK